MAHYHEPREGGTSIGLVLGIILAVVLLFAVLWFALAASDAGVDTPAAVPNEPQIENPSGGRDPRFSQPREPAGGTGTGTGANQPSGTGAR